MLTTSVEMTVATLVPGTMRSLNNGTANDLVFCCCCCCYGPPMIRGCEALVIGWGGSGGVNQTGPQLKTSSTWTNEEKVCIIWFLPL